MCHIITSELKQLGDQPREVSVGSIAIHTKLPSLALYIIRALYETLIGLLMKREAGEFRVQW